MDLKCYLLSFNSSWLLFYNNKKKSCYKLFAIIDCCEDKEFVFKMINFYCLKDTDCKTVVQIYSL